VKVLLGVTGGIAAYKAAELTRELQRGGVIVQVAMTEAAQEFVRPLTFASLTGLPVLTSLWEPTESVTAERPIEHIRVAQEIDALVVAPATANVIAKLAHGFADDVITTVALATRAPLLLAPAMNVVMWDHPATKAHVETLRRRGARIVEPGAGYLACGMTGDGRLADVETIADAVLNALKPVRDLEGETVLVTAGGTREAIDPVRFLGNRSSGKMGHAVADAALARGANVILITASDASTTACETKQVTTAAEMHRAVLDALPRATMVIKAAAVSDFRPREKKVTKLKRKGPLTLELEPVEDIVRDVVRRRNAETLVAAFAAETNDLLAEAERKLQDKGVDAVIANDVSEDGLGFESERNAAWFLTRDAEPEWLPERTKRQLAEAILDRMMALRKSGFRSRKLVAIP
jgi:phosphopantothenoylcysteine decarboxylase / phosphopantothenate---cysteine ligase